MIANIEKPIGELAALYRGLGPGGPAGGLGRSSPSSWC